MAPADTLLTRMQAFAAAMTAYDAVSTAALLAVGADPAGSLKLLDAALLDVPTLRQTELGLIAVMGEHSVTSGAECAAHWRSRTMSLLEGRRSAAVMLADGEQMARTRAMVIAVLEPTDPYRATLWEEDAEAASDPTEAARLSNDAFALRLANREFLAAARNRMRAASLAAAAGWLRRARRCGDEALAIAEQQDLRREQIQFRIWRFQSLLIADQAGVARQEVKAELDFVSRPCGALPDALERIYATGLTALTGPAGVRTAEAFGLASARALRDGEVGARQAAVVELTVQRDEQRLALLLLAAQVKGRFGDWDTPAEDILPLAESLAKTPGQRGQVYSAIADAAEGAGDVAAAIAAMERTVAALRPGPSATTLAQAQARLAALRADCLDAVRDPAMDTDEYVTRRSDVAVAALVAGQQQRALSILDSVAGLPCSDVTRGKLATLRGAGLYELDRLDEASVAFTEAAAVFEPALDQDPEGEGDWLGQRETALLLLAVTLTRLGRPRDAWIAAERARSPKLARALDIPQPDWPGMRDVLAARRAAVLTVQALRWGTLVLSAAPGEPEPQAVLLAGFRSVDMNRLLMRDLGDDSDAWNGVLMDAIPELSAGLGAPLASRLRVLAAGADILYLIPDAALWYAPWAAVEIAPGVPLAELIPFSLLPFARLLQACAPVAAPRRNTLAMAVGRDTGGFAFTGHLDLLAPLFGRSNPEWLRDGAATALALRDARPRDLLYVSCHGTIDHTTPQLDRASQLLLADGPLSAGTLAQWTLGRGLGSACLTFLNACQTGRFRTMARTELGGFPAAFLRAGRNTLIAPLTHVDPHAAGALAKAFSTALSAAPVLSGPVTAAALRTARLLARASGASPSDWAAHTMFGPDV